MCPLSKRNSKSVTSSLPFIQGSPVCYIKTTWKEPSFLSSGYKLPTKEMLRNFNTFRVKMHQIYVPTANIFLDIPVVAGSEVAAIFAKEHLLRVTGGLIAIQSLALHISQVTLTHRLSISCRGVCTIISYFWKTTNKLFPQRPDILIFDDVVTEDDNG